MSTPIRKIWFDRPTKDALSEYAWSKRTTSGAVIRAAIEDVRDNATDESVLADTDITSSSVQVSVKVPDDLWFPAMDSAAGAGDSFGSLVRRRIRKVLIDEGLIS